VQLLCKSHFKWTHTHCSVWGKLHNMLTCDMLLMFTCKSKICFWCSHAKVKYAFDVHMQKYILCCKPRIWSEVTKPVLTINVHFPSFDLFVDIFVISFSSNPGCPFTMKISVCQIQNSVLKFNYAQCVISYSHNLMYYSYSCLLHIYLTGLYLVVHFWGL